MRDLNDDESKLKALDQLFQQVGAYKSSNEYRMLIDVVRRFHYMAPYNAMLINVQKPGSRYVASAAQWKKDFQRAVIPGARPLVILHRFGPVRFVFELGDTAPLPDSKPFPEDLLQPFKTKGALSQDAMGNLLSSLPRSGIAYYEADHGTASAGSIRPAPGGSWRELPVAQQIVSVNIFYEMIVNKNMAREDKFATILHELAHLYCGHLGIPPVEKWNFWPRRTRLHISTSEFEAESVAWLVCERLGVSNPSDKYLSGYLSKNNEIPNISLETVLKATNTIESMLQGSFAIRKEVLRKTS